MASQRATAHLLNLQILRPPRTVCCFVSVRSEIDTRALLEHLALAGHRVAVPRIVDGQMEACLLDRLSPLVPGAFDIPTTNGPAVADVDVAIVPGLGFTPDGRRLGYGGGYYDRWLQAHPKVQTVGFGFQAQILPHLPTEQHDRRVGAVVTEAGVHRGAPARDLRVVAGVIRRGDRILATRRGPSMNHAGFWEFPDGKVEPGESDSNALTRELREELAIEVHLGEPIATATHPYPNASVTLVGLSATLDGDSPTLSEHDELRWLTVDELDTVPWAPADLPLVDAIR